MKTEHVGPAPPEVDQTSGVKVACSTSQIRASYLLRFSRSFRLYIAGIPDWTFELAKGLKTLTSKNVRSKRPPQNPFAAMSRRALLSLVVVLLANCSPVSGWRSGSLLTLGHTCESSSLHISRNSLCLMVGKPPVGHESA